MIWGESQRIEAVEAWWAAWRKEDYSWQGLAQRQVINPPLKMSAKQSLQDWWARSRDGALRNDETLEQIGELVRDPSGALWHIAHVPMVWADGSAAKADWDRDRLQKLNELLENRQRTSQITDADLHAIHGPDHRPQFEGVVVQHLPRRLIADPGFFNGAFKRCYIGEAFRAKGWRLGPGTTFENCLFNGDVFLDHCIAMGAVSFEGATFIRNASFRSAKFQGEVSFSGATFFTVASFDSATFECWAFFENARFLSANFPQARFQANAWFQNSTFDGLECGDARFERQAAFENVDLSEADDISFENVEFDGDADFSSVKWPDEPSVFGGIFRNARFASMANFRTPNFFQFSALDGARFDSQVTLDRQSAFSEGSFTQTLARIKASRADRQGPQVNLRMHQYEGAFRVLRKASERHGDRALELRLHQLELRTRRMQSSTPIWERSVSWIYDCLSGYGNSVGKPSLAIAGIWLVSGLIYWQWNGAHTRQATGDGFLEALRLSASSIFRPFDVWSKGSSTAMNWQSQFLDGFGSGHALMVRLALTLESVVGLVAFFLIALALRRKFQVS